MSAAASWSARVLSRSRLPDPVAGPNAASFRIPFPARAAEDCRTPGPAESIGWGAFHPSGDPPRSLGGYGEERGSVLECSSPLALSTREPRCGTKRRVLSRHGSSQSGRGLPHSGTVRSPLARGAFHPSGDPPRSLGGYEGERDSVPECASPLALSTREPRAGPNAVLCSPPVPSQSGRGQPHSGTVLSPLAWV